MIPREGGPIEQSPELDSSIDSEAVDHILQELYEGLLLHHEGAATDVEHVGSRHDTWVAEHLDLLNQALAAQGIER